MQGIKNIVVTGANRGIGLGITKYLASQQGWNIIMACRSPQTGQSIRVELNQKYPKSSIQVEQLDVSDSKSIIKCVQILRQKYKEIHVLVNNAGVLVDEQIPTPEGVRQTLKTNFYGTVQLSQRIIPTLADRGKIISLGSNLGRTAYNSLSADLQQRWKNDNLSRQDIFKLIQEYEQAVQQGKQKQKGWKGTYRFSYAVSKLAINLYASALAKNQQIMKKNIQVYSCCPGYVKTDMTSYKGAITVEQGIKTPVFLIQAPFQINEAWQGGYFDLKERISPFDLYQP